MKAESALHSIESRKYELKGAYLKVALGGHSTSMHNTLWNLATVELRTASMTKNMYGSIAEYRLSRQAISQCQPGTLLISIPEPTSRPGGSPPSAQALHAEADSVTIQCSRMFSQSRQQPEQQLRQEACVSPLRPMDSECWLLMTGVPTFVVIETVSSCTLG